MKQILCITTLLVATNMVWADMTPIDSTNTVGYVEITASVSANTIIAVPFEACLQDGDPGMLSDLVATNGLTGHATEKAQADQLVVLTTNTTAELIYYYYWLQNEVGWSVITTEQLMPDGTRKTLTPPAASAFPVARGKAFWVKRVAGTENTVYIKGQVATAKQSTPIAKGLNLVGVGSGESVSLNNDNLSWSGAYGGTGNITTSDKIIVCNSNGTFTHYYFYNPASPEFPALVDKWVTSGGAVADVNLNAGKGFWYLRQSGQSGFNLKPDGE